MDRSGRTAESNLQVLKQLSEGLLRSAGRTGIRGNLLEIHHPQAPLFDPVFLHSASQFHGVSISLSQHDPAAAGPEELEKYLNAMPETVRKENDRVNIAMGLESPLLPRAIAYFKDVFESMDAALTESPWLAGDTFSLADISLGVYVTRLKSFQMAPLWSNLVHLNEWYGRFVDRPSYQEGVINWGDKTTGKRREHGLEALAKVSALWNAA